MIESDDSTTHLEVLAMGPTQYTRSHKGYFVNGYKFHTRSHGNGRVTDNSGVCVRGTTYNQPESDYYGWLDEVLEIEYRGTGRCVVVLFKCTWFDNVHGVRVNKHKLVDVKPTSRIQADDPFVLASQVEQVYYTPYPFMKNDLKFWWAVVKTKPRGIYEVAESVPEDVEDENMEEEQFFQFDERFDYTNEVSNNEPLCLVTGEEIIEVLDTPTNQEMYDGDAEEDDQECQDTDDDEEELDLSDHGMSCVMYVK